QHDATGNKEGNNWENYQEQGTEVTSTAEGKNGVWVQVDLGASYPLEVINLKRQVYEAQPNIVNGNPGDGKRLNGTKISYQNTAIVIGNKEDLSDGQIVYCEGNPTLPDGVEKPESISSPYQEAMGGQWFYMDYENKNGLGATELGTTKEARYIRVYTENPKGAAVKFMELGIYGYENEQDVQEQNGPRRVIDNENPMMIATAYSNDVYQIGQEKSPELQGYNTVEGRWNAIPDDLKKNNVLLLHTNNLRQFAPDHIGQAYLQAFHEHGLQIAYEQGAPIMLLGLTAAATPENGGTQYNITADMDYGWLDLMYRMYPNMQGVFNTENFWVGGGIPPTCEGSAKMLEIADRFGGFFVWADQDHGSTVTNIISNENMKKALKEHKDAFYLIYKNTSSSQPDDLKTSSFFQGSWLAGYTGGWGMLSDTWAWDKQFSKLWEGNGGNKYSGWQRLCGEPEALLGMQMMSTYLGGGVIYTFEFPEVVYGTRDTNSPANTHVLTELFRYIVNNPAPSKKEIMEETKAVLYGNVSSSFYSGLSGTPTGFQIYETGRYGIIPVVPAWGSRAEVTEKLIQEADNLGVAPPNVLDVNDKNLSGQTKQKYFKDLYPIEYVGNAFADKWDGTWYLYNNKVNKNEKQHAILPLEGEEESARLKVEMEPHEFMIMNESGDGTAMDITLNNYRVNKDKTVFDNVHNLNWSGTFAPGQGVIPGKVSVYEYMDKYNVVNAPEGKLSPEDNELRTTTFELTKLAKKPEVKVVKGQQPDTDGQPQYTEPKVEFNEETGKAVITIQTNGWVDLSITGLEFVYDEDAQKIEDEPIKSERTNLARGKNVSFSKDASDNSRKSHAVDGNKTNRDNYSDPGGNTGGAHWLQVDLGGVHHVEEVNLYRYWSDSRKYHDTVVLLSPDSSFDPAKTLVLWNGNRDANREWPASLSGTQGETHKLPKGEKEEYIETKDGKTMKVYDEGVCWLDPDTKTPLPKEGEHFDAGYVRVYMNGNIDGTKEGPTNHVVELEVMGETGDVVI
ncbi:MAG: glycoside hydrolase family 98 domain-containing protein, partial [Mediterraneibacter gnavus]